MIRFLNVIVASGLIFSAFGQDTKVEKEIEKEVKETVKKVENATETEADNQKPSENAEEKLAKEAQEESEQKDKEDTAPESVQKDSKEEAKGPEKTESAEPDSGESAETEATKSTGTLKITTDPDNAVLIVDGANKGKTPLTIEDLTPGKHSLVIKKAGHFLKKASVTVTAGSTKELSFTLLKPATLIINSKPSEATVSLNKKQSGKTPYSNSKLKPKEYLVTVQKSGYIKQSKKVTLESGDVDSLTFTLREAKKKETPAKAETASEASEEDTKKSKIARIIILSTFAVFGISIFIAELAGR